MRLKKINIKILKNIVNSISRSKHIGTVFLALIAIVLFFKVRRISLYIIFVLITGILTYIKKLYHLPIDITPLFFLEIVITRYYGLGYMLLFILLGYVIPAVLGGGGFKWESYAFVSVSIFCNLISVFMVGLELQVVGYLTSIIQYVGGIFIGMVMKPFFVAAADGIANVTNNLLWFLIFTDLVIFLLG